MPSDERIEQTLTALSGRTQDFRSALAVTIEQVRGFIGTQRGEREGMVERIAMELGPFAADRVDPAEFGHFVGPSLESDAETLNTVDKALETLTGIATQGDEIFVADVESGGSLAHVVKDALASLGRVFGAARVFEVAKSGLAHETEHTSWLDSFPFSRWSGKERRLGPPLVVTVDGSDLRAGNIAEYMDGAQKIVLVVRGEPTPVPLVRLITPGTFVVQATGADELQALAASEGPGVGALVPESAARFVHNPATGSEVHDRLTISHLPEDKRRKPVGGVSIAQQAEELRQLKALGAAPALSEAGAEATVGGVVNPADKLAAWLLAQADLKDIE